VAVRGVGGGGAVVIGAELGAAAVVLAGLVELLCSRDAGFELGVVTVGCAVAEIGGMETIVPMGAEIGCSVGVDVMASDMDRGLTVKTEGDMATGTDVVMMFAFVGGSGMTRVLVLVL